MEVIEAADGLTGVQLAKRELPDLILLGVMMPGLDGWQVAEELAKDQETREIPIVFLTARDALKDRVRGFDLGALDYITKPFNPMELALRVRGLLERIERGEREELRREKISELRARMDAERNPGSGTRIRAKNGDAAGDKQTIHYCPLRHAVVGPEGDEETTTYVMLARWIDDEDDSREVCVEYLNRWGFSTLGDDCYSDEAAAEAAAAGEFSLSEADWRPGAPFGR
jgi:CheY-like chemotaxis protein